MRYMFLALFLATPAAATSPIAQVICAPTAQMNNRLVHDFGVSREATGLRSPEEVLEVWTNDQDGRWALVMSYATGNSCIVAMGEHWDRRNPV